MFSYVFNNNRDIWPTISRCACIWQLNLFNAPGTVCVCWLNSWVLVLVLPWIYYWILEYWSRIAMNILLNSWVLVLVIPWIYYWILEYWSRNTMNILLNSWVLVSYYHEYITEFLRTGLVLPWIYYWILEYWSRITMNILLNSWILVLVIPWIYYWILEYWYSYYHEYITISYYE